MSLEADLRAVLNKHSAESASNTPDFILAGADRGAGGGGARNHRTRAPRQPRRRDRVAGHRHRPPETWPATGLLR